MIWIILFSCIAGIHLIPCVHFSFCPAPGAGEEPGTTQGLAQGTGLPRRRSAVAQAILSSCIAGIHLIPRAIFSPGLVANGCAGLLCASAKILTVDIGPHGLAVTVAVYGLLRRRSAVPRAIFSPGLVANGCAGLLRDSGKILTVDIGPHGFAVAVAVNGLLIDQLVQSLQYIGVGLPVVTGNVLFQVPHVAGTGNRHHMLTP